MIPRQQFVSPSVGFGVVRTDYIILFFSLCGRRWIEMYDFFFRKKNRSWLSKRDDYLNNKSCVPISSLFKFFFSFFNNPWNENHKWFRAKMHTHVAFSEMIFEAEHHKCDKTTKEKKLMSRSPSLLFFFCFCLISTITFSPPVSRVSITKGVGRRISLTMK